MYVHKALDAVLLIWCLYIVLLSKVTPRYITLFTKGMSHLFIHSMSSWTIK
jgi:hypothetical protein